jgi:uncharacterized membrane protein
MTRALLLCVHLLAAAAWVGGMAAIYFAVRPAAAATLPPPQRLPFMAAAIGRFLDLVAVAIAALLASALALIAHAGGWSALHWSARTMAVIGVAMIAIYGHLRLAPYRRLARAVGESQWPPAAAALDLVRRLVLLNLVLGTLVFVIAVAGPAW